MKKIELLKKKIARHKAAQHEAETELEKKSAEIYELNRSLEEQIEIRTNELKIARDEAISANNSKSQFLANMSHEIRTPLNGLIGFIGLLQRSSLSQTQKEQVEIIAKSGQLLLNLVNDVLEFSKIEAGKLKLNRLPFDLKTTVEELVDVMSHQVFEKGLEFPVLIDKNIPKILLGDESRIRQVLLNLIGNACKFTHSGEVSVRVDYNGRRAMNEHSIYFEVRDTGIGISEGKINSIFSAFEQADSSNTRKYGGTGLGLTISKQIIEAMGSTISVESIEGSGTQFSFTLNFTGVQNSTQSLLDQILQDQVKTPEFVALIIQNKNVKSILRNILFNLKIKFEEFDSINNIKWDCDINMNRTVLIESNLALVNTARDYFLNAKNEKIHIIIMSPQKDKFNLQNYYEGFDIDIISKPIKQAELINSIKMKSTFSQKEPNICKLDEMENKNVNKKSTSLKLLLVEDNIINQQVAIAMLKVHGFKADLAMNGKEAIEKHQLNFYDIILMDCQMPTMDGFEATTEIRKFDKQVKIVAMTANVFSEIKERCFEVGMNEFVTKPFSDEDLNNVIQKMTLDSIKTSVG